MSIFSCEHEVSYNLSTTSERRPNTQRWAVILAGGDGTRLQSLTRTISGDDRPKQFCPIIGGRTLLDQTRHRVALSVPAEQTLTIVTETHERFYKPLLKNTAKNRLLVQPVNKGTAPAILFSLLRIAQLSPNATVAFFPSDHYFADDDEFMSHIDTAFSALETESSLITLLGIKPDGAEVEYGWIEPETSLLGSLPRAITRVKRFWEKPPLNLARRLMREGSLWNSFVMVARVEAFLKMTARALPDLYEAFVAVAPSLGTNLENRALTDLYASLTSSNFSHEVLASRPQDLTVMRVSDVGWSDLGEPRRVFSTLQRIGVQTQWAAPVA